MRFFGKSGNTDKMTTKLPNLKAPSMTVRSLKQREFRIVPSLPTMGKWPFVARFMAVCCILGTAASQLSAVQPPAATTATEISQVSAGQRRGGDAIPWHQSPKVDPTPQARLASAIWTLQARRAVSAKIRQKIDIFGKQLIGSGTYLEQRREPVALLKLELKIQLGQNTTSLVQVCDGKYLWTYRKLLGNGKLSRLDAIRASSALKEAEKSGGGDMQMLPGLGGLPQLLRGLHATFDFVSAEKGTLGSKPREMTVWRLEGRWKPKELARLLPDQKEAIEAGKAVDLAKLPKHLPDHIVLLLGDEDKFPYRIEYRRQLPGKTMPSCKPASRELVTMEWLDVVMDRPVDPGRFEYNPAGLKFTDTTSAFIKRLKVEK
jgi:hypothetical protein